MKKFFSELIEFIMFTSMFFILEYINNNIFKITYLSTIFIGYMYHTAKYSICEKLKLISDKGKKTNTVLEIGIDLNEKPNLIPAILGIIIIQVFIYPLIIFNIYTLSFFTGDLAFLNYFTLSALYMLILELIMEPLFLNTCVKKILKYKDSETSKDTEAHEKKEN